MKHIVFEPGVNKQPNNNNTDQVVSALLVQPALTNIGELILINQCQLVCADAIYHVTNFYR
jgi:hypothetical protein